MEENLDKRGINKRERRVVKVIAQQFEEKNK